MSSFLDKFISDTYHGVLHSDLGLSPDTVSIIFDGDGNKSSLSLGRDNNGAVVTGCLSADCVHIFDDLFVGGNIKVDKVIADDLEVSNLTVANKLKAGKVEYPVSNIDTNIFSLIYPIGSIYMNFIEVDPASLFAGTVWTKVSEGRFLAGVGAGNDGIIAKTFTVGENFGEYEHTLSIGEMPAHKHDTFAQYIDKGDGSPRAYPGFNESIIGGNTSTVGSSLPHNNLPPSYAVFIWKRTL